MDSLPQPDFVLQQALDASKVEVAGLEEQLGKVDAALVEAKAQLAERAENERVVQAAKATAAQLKVRYTVYQYI